MADAAALSNALVAALVAVDPVGLGGVALRSAPGLARDRWLASLTALLPAPTPLRRIPLHSQDDRLFGGLDLAATLRAGRPVALRGVLAEADGGVLVLAMAERIAASTAAGICAAMDAHQVVVERHGISARHASRFGVVALDEGIDDERPPARLLERLAFRIELLAPTEPPSLFTVDDIASARSRLPLVRMADDIVDSLCATSIALGVDSARATLFVCRAARAVAALDGRDEVRADDAALAAGLVLAPRATQVPATPPENAADDAASDGEAETPEPAEPAEPAESPAETEQQPQDAGLVDDQVLEAALAAIPPGLLASIAGAQKGQRRGAPAGRSGAAQLALQRGRPIGSRRAGLRSGARLNLIETLRTAAPWQALRWRELAEAGVSAPPPGRVLVRQEDFRVWRFKQRSETTTVFVVDASGSAALHRLAETKGAVELLLADCYVRRDSVAVIAFRGAAAEVLLPPTRSLVRAKRSLAGLPGGGGTPLAAGIAAAVTLVDAVRRKGATPLVVLLTDGRANIARDGSPGRARATADALDAARHLRALQVAALLLDTSPQAQDSARALADAMGARYLPLPHAGAAVLSSVVRASSSHA